MKINDIFEQGGVGVVANNAKQARDPRYSTSMTKDVKPGSTAKQAAKFGNKLGKDGTPPKLRESMLIEAGLNLVELVKHGGRYFDELIRKIRSGEPIAIEPEYTNKYGKEVVIDPSEAKRLMLAFYPDGDKDKMVLGINNNVKAVDSSSFRTKGVRLQQPFPGETISFGALSKTAVSMARKGNKGDQGEACLGAAVVAKFIKKGGEVSAQDLINILGSMKQGVQGNVLSGQITTRIEHESGKVDTINFTLMLNKRSFDPLMEAVGQGQNMDRELLNLFKSATMFVNKTLQGLQSALAMVATDPNSNHIEVRSDGVSDNKGTKADLHVTVDGAVINLISIKVKAQQFGQGSGSNFAAIQTFFNSIIGLDISPYQTKFRPEKTKEDKEHNVRLVFGIYDKIFFPTIEKIVGRGDAGEAALLTRLAQGIQFHATNNTDIDIVHLDYIKPGYKLLRITSDLIEVMKQLKIEVRLAVSANERNLIFSILPDTPNAREIIGNKKMLLKIRSSFKASEQYLRNTLEMGSGLVDLIKIEQSLA